MLEDAAVEVDDVQRPVGAVVQIDRTEALVESRQEVELVVHASRAQAALVVVEELEALDQVACRFADERVAAVFLGQCIAAIDERSTRGGDLTQMVHDKYPEMLESIHGITEETTTGVHRLLEMMEAGELKVPAINVNDSVTKSKNDNKYGCRHSLNDAIKRGTDMLMAGKRALVIGYGDVGKGSAASLRQEGMVVRVVEIDPICAMQACMDGYEVVSPYVGGNNTGKIEDIDTRLMSETDLIVTCTGNVNVCDENLLRTVASNAVVCNIGHFDTEIDTAFMRDNWRWEVVKPQVHKIYRSDDPKDYLLLLSEGRLVNLGNATGHPSRIMDGSFANQVLAQMYLYERAWADHDPNQRQDVTVEVLPKALDEEVAGYMVQGFGGVITKLTESQADYINVAQEGPFKPEAYKY